MGASYSHLPVDLVLGPEKKFISVPNQPSGPGHQIYAAPRAYQPVTRFPGADSGSTDPSCLPTTYNGDSSPQLPQGIMPQSMQQHSLMQWPHERLVGGTNASEHVACVQLEESTARAGDVDIRERVVSNKWRAVLAEVCS
jgi:hypothetical protein